MLFEQYHPQDLLTPSINDGGINKLDSSLTSLDFYLLDDIDAYLSPIESKKTKNYLINDSTNDNSQFQEEFFSNLDLSDFTNFDEKSDFFDNPIPIDELEIEKWISQSAFPSPPMDTTNSPLSSVDDTSSIFPWIGDEYTRNTDMVVPPSPPSSSIGSSPAPGMKKTKLSIVERKMRKKGQNKTAAEKYRVKKKSERQQLLDRHLILHNKNKELKSELENLSYRVQQFKQLFAEYVQMDLPISN
jgi:hypothetical protein